MKFCVSIDRGAYLRMNWSDYERMITEANEEADQFKAWLQNMTPDERCDI